MLDAHVNPQGLPAPQSGESIDGARMLGPDCVGILVGNALGVIIGMCLHRPSPSVKVISCGPVTAMTSPIVEFAKR